MDRNVSELVDKLCEAIENSELYKEYVNQQNLVKNQPDVIEKINEIRSLNLRIQTMQNSDEAYEELKRLEERFAVLAEDKRVFDFIEVEVRFIGIYKEAERRIMSHIQFI